MSRILIKQTLDNIDKEVTLAGHVATKRDHGKVTFIDLRDESGSLQIVGYKMLGELKMESVISITKIVKKRPTGQINPHLPKHDHCAACSDGLCPADVAYDYFFGDNA